MGKRVCIIGGSGFVGRAIARQAVAAGHQVTVACRHPARARDQLVKGVRLARVDVTDGSGLAEAVAGVDVVINLVGLLFEKGRQNFEAAHTKGAGHVLEACRSAGVKQLLHMSALGAGQVEGSKYAGTKAEAEALVAASGLNYTIFRPSIIYGAGDSFFNKFKAMSQMLPVLPVISGETRFQPVWVEDVARAFVASIGNSHVAGCTFELGGPASYTFRELLELMLKELGIKRTLIPVPGVAAFLMAAFTSVLPTPPITRDQLVLLGRDNVVEGDEPFPAIFGKAAPLEQVLPSYICGNRAETIQHDLDDMRTRYRKGGV
ncbi:NADH dehydrogenase [Mariprofundus ferrinatatus]|uniref:NADH dehydrogenase n=1 Tax=Mariprofundus ferrinatatus TaxID=1921087 RepID=A0A2K8LFN7_9PROT|nr:complex I NDUFA9 subunit family protein [Mariprofundus ferrinatatus]ATX83086.1 NADH dehydrogenase [Mariprofundus ferrinatatus]